MNNAPANGRGHHRFWSLLGPEEQGALLEIAEQVTYAPGSRIFAEGEPSESVLVILSGWVMITSGFSNGEETAVALRRPGDLVGESASADLPRSNTVAAQTEVGAQKIAADRFSAILDRYPGAKQAFERTHRDRRIEADRKRVEVATMNGDQRLARLFLEIAECDDEDRDVELCVPLRRESVAQLICASVGTVERTLRNWRDREIVATGYRRYTLRDVHKLGEIAKPDRTQGPSAHDE
jgi:CRP/FNR family transcriptional regulator, cyclic AMP receptor protein